MFLKSLTLKGFKSFADPATLVFEPGVTVVVGPNGSGKSNVVDAVAWVLGAQGPRSVRSSRMEDVIFAGSADRPALGRAEVSLTIDNRSGRLPNGVAEITITRTLFRSGDSEYAINGQACRLLDVQELLSDSGVGRQQHVIVGQGQLDQVLNARPEDRRATIEEAAGVLKHRRRRERAERRLSATDENLERLSDLVREVRRQIRPLERQATAAKSQAELAAELRALRLHLVGRDLDLLLERRRSAEDERGGLRIQEGELRAALVELDQSIESISVEVERSEEKDLGTLLGRAQRLAERNRSAAAVLAERSRSLAAAIESVDAADALSALEAERLRLAGELESADSQREGLVPEAQEVERAESLLADDAAVYESDSGGVHDLHVARQAVSDLVGQVQGLRRSLDQEKAAVDRIDQRMAVVDKRVGERSSETEALSVQVAELDTSHPRLTEALELARHEVETAAAELESLDAQARAAEAERHKADARAGALVRAAEVARGSAGVEALAGVPGVVGTLGDLVEVDPGWRLAFEAAAGAALAAVVVDGTRSARQALARLHEAGSTGTVLAPIDPGRSHGPLPSGAVSILDHVRPVVASLGGALGRLLVDAVVVDGGWSRAVDVALDRPDLVVVTREGDRFASSGWRVHSEGDEATPAAAEEALRMADRAASVAEVAAVRATEARIRLQVAVTAESEAAREAERATDRRQMLEVARDRLVAEVVALAEERDQLAHDRRLGAEQVQRDEVELARLEEALPALRAAAATVEARQAELEERRNLLEERRIQVDRLRRNLELRTAALAERKKMLTDRLLAVDSDIEAMAARHDEISERRDRLRDDSKYVGRLRDLVDGQRVVLEGEIGRLQDLHSRHVEAMSRYRLRLESIKRDRSLTDVRLVEARERSQALEIDLAEVKVRYQATVESLRRELDSSPEEAQAASCPELGDGVDPAERVNALQIELARIGPVNPLAALELDALKERDGFLTDQIEDVRRARRELIRVVDAIDDEIVRIFTEAFADVNEHFSALVSVLFPGGSGRLTLTDPSDPLHTGVEVEARPAGKNVRKLSLLSGGERSLVALAFLFAVFRSRPSPFYLMDEVEAALDDVNLHRFLGLLDEFRLGAQLIVVSHQKRTMESADALYGVTMTPGGSSKVVSQKVRHERHGEAAAATSGV